MSHSRQEVVQTLLDTGVVAVVRVDEPTELPRLARARRPSQPPNDTSTSHNFGVAVLPGCLTPTEIVAAWSAGADVIKLFPGRVATPGYFSDLKGPFPSIKLMPTGNVDRKTAPEYIKAGAVAVGVGKALVDPAALHAGDWAQIIENARDFRALVDEARGTVR